MNCYIQILSSNHVCQTFPLPSSIYIHITPEEKFLKQNGMSNHLFISQQLNIKVLQIFIVPFNAIRDVFLHTQDKVLDAQIIDNKLTIIGDNEQIICKLDIEYDNIKRYPISIIASRTFLSTNNLPFY